MTRARPGPSPQSTRVALYDAGAMDRPAVSEPSSPALIPSNGDENASVPPPAEVNEFLRKKRKAREHKACYPCRLRKVK
jgi:hypothetical protein